MMDISETSRWIGNLRGSRIGSLYVAKETDAKFSVSLGIMGGADIRLLAIRQTGSVDLPLLLEASNEQFGFARIESETDVAINGVWQFIGGASGVFDLTRHSTFSGRTDQIQPEQLRNREAPLGAVTLYRRDLERLIVEMEKLVGGPCLTNIRAVENGQIVIEPANTYLGRKDFVEVVRSMSILVTENTTYPLKKIANVHLNDDGTSQLVITSPDELWTEATFYRLSAFIRQFSSRFTYLLHKYGLNINGIILFTVLLWIPDRPFAERVIVFCVAFAAMLAIAKSHSLIPYNRVYLDPDVQKRPFAKETPAAVLAVVAGAVTAALSAVPKLFAHAETYLSTIRHWLRL